MPTTAESLGFDRERLRRWEEVVQRAVDERQYAAVSTLLARHGQVVQLTSVGSASAAGRSIPASDHIYRIASMTKPVTAAALLLLYEEGRWSPKDPIAKFIPEFSQLKVYRGLDDFGAMLLEEPEHPPTMRELMTHTAGFGYGRGAEPAERLYRDEQGRDLFACGSLQALVARLAKAPLLDQPSRRWIYSLSMDLQGYIIERLSGRTLPEFMQARLFAPLGMNDTAFYVPTDKRNRFAELYRADRDGALIPMPVAPLELTYEQTPSLPQGGAGLVSTTGDYFRFAQMLLNGGTLDGVRLLAPSTTKLMMSNHLSDRLMADYSRPLANCPRLGLGYGYNGFVVTDPGRADVPLGAGSYGWDGAFGTWFWVDPSADLVFIGMVQRGELPGESPVGPPTDLQELARAVTYQALIHPER